MKCPYCSHDFPLTWSRYLRAPLGHHVCPACHKPSRLEFGVPQFLFLAATMVVLTVPFTLLCYRWLGGYWALLGVIPGAVIMFPLDKMLDNKYRKPRRLESEEKNP